MVPSTGARFPRTAESRRQKAGMVRGPAQTGKRGPESGSVPVNARTVRAVRMLVAEPELGAGLTREEFEQAQLHVVLPAVELPAGSLDLDDLRRGPDILGDLYGFLVLKGTLMIKLHMSGRQAGRLVSTGGLLLLDGPLSESFPVELEWSVVDACRLACIDRRLITIAQRWPALMAAIMRRAAQQARYALLQQAISQLPKVEDRLLALFWSLADRQGVVRVDGIWVELTATHDTLAHLVGAQRPTVSLGLARLAEARLLQPQAGGWLISPDSVGAFERPTVAAP